MDLIITHVCANNLQNKRIEKLLADMEQLCETASGKADSHIVIGLLPRSQNGRQLHYKRILYINRRLKAMSHNKIFNFLDVYWQFDEKPTCLKMDCISVVRLLVYLGHLLV